MCYGESPLLQVPESNSYRRETIKEAIERKRAELSKSEIQELSKREPQVPSALVFKSTMVPYYAEYLKPSNIWLVRAIVEIQHMSAWT